MLIKDSSEVKKITPGFPGVDWNKPQIKRKIKWRSTVIKVYGLGSGLIHVWERDVNVQIAEETSESTLLEILKDKNQNGFFVVVNFNAMKQLTLNIKTHFEKNMDIQIIFMPILSWLNWCAILKKGLFSIYLVNELSDTPKLTSGITLKKDISFKDV